MCLLEISVRFVVGVNGSINKAVRGQRDWGGEGREGRGGEGRGGRGGEVRGGEGRGEEGRGGERRGGGREVR